MKKTIALVGGLAACAFLLAGCTGEPAGPAADSQPSAGGSSAAAAPADPSGADDWLEGKTIMEVPSICDWAYDTSMETLTERATEIVVGTVEGIAYTEVEGHAWTIVEFKPEQVLKGSMQPGEAVEIYTLGGYIALEDMIDYYQDGFRYEDMTEEEIQNTVVHEVVDGEESPPEAGGRYLFYLAETRANSPLPDGAYERVRGTASQFMADGDSFTRLPGEDNEEETYSLGQIEALLAE